MPPWSVILFVRQFRRDRICSDVGNAVAALLRVLVFASREGPEHMADEHLKACDTRGIDKLQ